MYGVQSRAWQNKNHKRDFNDFFRSYWLFCHQLFVPAHEMSQGNQLQQGFLQHPLFHLHHVFHFQLFKGLILINSGRKVPTILRWYFIFSWLMLLLQYFPTRPELSSVWTVFPLFFRTSAAISTFRASYTLLLIFCSSLHYRQQAL